MNLSEYKDTLKRIIDSTNNEALLKQWKEQLELDVQQQEEIEKSATEINKSEQEQSNQNPSIHSDDHPFYKILKAKKMNDKVGQAFITIVKKNR